MTETMTETTTTPPSGNTILTFTAADGWCQGPNPLPPGWHDNADLRKAGWHQPVEWEENDDCSSFYFDLWQHDQHGYISTFWHGDSGKSIALPTLPDLIAYLGVVLPLVDVAARLDDRDRRLSAETAKRREKYEQQAAARRFDERSRANGKMWRDKAKQVLGAAKK